ncbi:MAG: mechanosensitive ion channel [Gemmatimonadetes bacterium]|nr:mechanosensitive ion channel [Gemmatimonadota bacterium]
MQSPLPLDQIRTRFDEPLFIVGGTAVTVASVISFVVFVLAAYAASWLVRRSLHRVYRRREVDEGVQHALDRLLHYAIIALGAFVALENLGVSITALAGVGAILAVGIGFGLQNIAQNFVSGLILLLERPVKKGDFVEVGEVRGTVRDIRARATVVTTLDNVDIIVPNGQFITEPVTNETYGDRRVRVRIAVGVAYGSDTERVRRALLRVAEASPEVLADPPPQVLFKDFGESSLDFELLAWLADPRDENPVLSQMRFAIDQAFRAEGITIPFPQRDLHVRSREQGMPGNRE